MSLKANLIGIPDSCLQTFLCNACKDKEEGRLNSQFRALWRDMAARPASAGGVRRRGFVVSESVATNHCTLLGHAWSV